MYSEKNLKYRVNELTPREKEVLELTADGYTSSEIASKWGLHTRSITSYNMIIKDKLESKNMAHAVAKYIRGNDGYK